MVERQAGGAGKMKSVKTVPESEPRAKARQSSRGRRGLMLTVNTYEMRHG